MNQEISKSTYQAILPLIILLGPKLRAVKPSSIREIIGAMAADEGISSFDYLMDLKGKKILTQTQVNEILGLPKSR